MAQYIGFGNGSDGAVTLSGTDAPIDSSCSGTAATTSLSATNASFAAGQIILIHQSRGTGAGSWEINQIGSYSIGTITTSLPLANTYTDSGASQAQVLVLKQYTDVTISGTFTGKDWDGNVGGIVAFLACGTVTISGTLSVNSKGFRGGLAVASTNAQGRQGEGTAGAGTQGTSANGNGGGGGNADGDGRGGAGGGNANAGTNNTFSTGGASSGVADLSTINFGGGGGAGGQDDTAIDGNNHGGDGGGIVMIWANTFTLSGSITSTGANGTTANASYNGGGGGGAGGSVYVVARNITLGTNKITVTAGSGGSGGSGVVGTAGSEGRIAVSGCTISGSTSPTANSTLGGQSFCTVKHGIL